MKGIYLGLLSIICSLIPGEGIQAQKEKEIWVGCEYFNGWWQESPNKWEKRGKDWRAKYPEM